MRSHVISSRMFVPFLLTLLLLVSACGGTGSTSNTGNSSSTPNPTVVPTIVSVDAYGTPISFPSTAPQRIVSLVPTTSDMLGALHLASKVVGVDSFTTYPADLASLPKVSNNGKYNIEQIVKLKPDLVLSYGQDTKLYDSQLTQLGLHVVDLPSGNLTEILQEMNTIGKLTLTQDTASKVVSQLQQRIATVKAAVAGTPIPKVMIELDDSTPGKPYVFGGGSYGDEMLQDANGQNIFHNNTGGGGFPQVTDETVISDNPQFIILTEPAQYGGDPATVAKRPNWNSIAAVQMHHVDHLNTNLLGHPGPRLVDALQCLAQYIHSDKFTTPLPGVCNTDV